MKVSHRISFPGGKDFEQHETIFELDGEEFKGTKFENLNALEQGQLLQTILCINGLLFQRAEGYIEKKDYEERKGRIMSLLKDHVKDALLEILA